jgi:outer membrane protein OmpA-like peptidoglycan-associated protein
MKHLKIAFLALLLITSYSNANAQDAESPWMLNFSINSIDVSRSYDASSGYFGSYNYNGNHLNIVPFVSKVSLGRYIGSGFSVELASAVNRIDDPRLGEGGDDVTFVGLDLNFKYNITHNKDGWLDPFLYAGAGENWVGVNDGIGINIGFGLDMWINDHIGVNFMSGYKKVNTPEPHDFEIYQHSLGLIWKFGKNPAAEEVIDFRDIDSDGDGVNDCCDECIDTPGLAEFDGCPDTDGDGIIDSKDKCPKTPGLKILHGCPDRDGDGVADKDDACPDVPGPKTNAGCPFKDTDGDGVIDLIDNCVNTPGPASNKGCPEVFVDYATIDEAARGIHFDTGKDEIRPEVGAILDEVARILNLPHNQQFNFSIDGHTDSVGTDESNNALADARAAAVRSYLMSKGVNPNRITTQGFGEGSPIDTNDTREGRQNNRRVEINEVK